MKTILMTFISLAVLSLAAASTAFAGQCEDNIDYIEWFLTAPGHHGVFGKARFHDSSGSSSSSGKAGRFFGGLAMTGLKLKVAGVNRNVDAIVGSHKMYVKVQGDSTWHQSDLFRCYSSGRLRGFRGRVIINNVRSVVFLDFTSWQVD